MNPRTRPATPDLEAFYADAMSAVQGAVGRHPHVRALEVIAALGRAAGYAVAMCYPDERDLAIETVMVNLRQALADVGAQGPDRPGVNQR